MIHSRSQRTNLASNQENSSNPSSLNQSNNLLPSKTPSRQQPQQNGGGKQPLGGAGAGLTAKNTNRVLGAKDANKGKSSSDPLQLVISKPPPSQQIQQPQASTSRLLRTPSPGLRKFAPLSFLSPDDGGLELGSNPLDGGDDDDMLLLEQEGKVQVEIGGGSSRDYDEPFIPELDGFELPDFKAMQAGKQLRGLSFLNCSSAQLQSYEEWFAEDAEERNGIKLEFEEVDVDHKRLNLDENSSNPLGRGSSSMFPVPATKAPPVPVLKAPLTTQKPLATISTSARQSLLAPPGTAPRTTLKNSTLASRPAPPSTTANRPRAVIRPTVPLSSSRSAARLSPTLAPSTASSSARPTTTVAVTRTPVPPSRNTNKPISRPPLPGSTRRPPLPRPTNRPQLSTKSSIRSISKSSSSSSPSVIIKENKKDSAEKALGIFGIVDDGLLFEENGEEGEEFRFEL